MDDLPQEILEIIILEYNMSLRDVLNLCLVNKTLYNRIRHDETLWKNWLHKMFPLFKDICCDDWYKEIKYIFHLQSATYNFLQTLAGTFNMDNNWMNLADEKPNSFIYLKYHLLDIIHTKRTINSIKYIPTQIYGNRTIQYLAGRIYRLLKVNIFKKKYLRWYSLPDNEKFYDFILLIISELLQSMDCICYNDLCQQFDNIAKSILASLSFRNPIYNSPNIESDLNLYKKYKQRCSYWEIGELCEIILALDNYLLREFKVVENNGVISNSYINRVLEEKCGFKMVLNYIKQSIGRRLGINFVVSPNGNNMLYIDKNGSVYNEYHQQLFIPCDFNCMETNVKQLIKSVPFLYRIECICDMILDPDAFIHLNKLDLWNKIPFDNNCGQLQKRHDNLKYAVGMIMKTNHGKCVIIGWFYSAMGIENNVVPVYNVLDEHRHMTVIPQNDISPSTFSPELDKLDRIGLYFSHYFGNHYVPNPVLERQYPDDGYVRMKFYRDTWSSPLN